ncbi:MAG TPA: cytochrome c oxidase subunit II [Steroidobacteraceae bacterium]|jgi:cytochrome c oxidase subunit 2
MKIVKTAAAALTGCLPAGVALAAWDLNMPSGVTELSREIYGLHMLILWVCVLIAVVVFGVMIFSIWRFRRSKHPEPASFDHSTRAEIIWTIIPIAILVGMAIPAAATLVKIEDTRNSDLTIKVTGYQWRWHYEYLDQNVAFFSTLDRDSDAARQLGSGVDPSSVDNYLLDVDRPLVVPRGAKVRLLLTAADVIHAWWVPALGMKKDAIPGFVNEMWFRADQTGIYRGQCAELCGRDHAFMPIVVDVREPEDYERWLAEQQGGAESDNAAAQTVAKAE